MINSISIRGGLKSFMLKNCKVDFLGNSKVAFHFRVAGGGMQSLSSLRNQRQMKNSPRAEQFASTSSEKLALSLQQWGFQNNEKTMEHG